MKLQANKADYDISDVKGFDILDRGDIWIGDIRTNPAAYTMRLSQTPWGDLVSMREKSTDGGKRSQVTAIPVYVALRSDHLALGFFPCPDRDYEVEIDYMTLNKL